MSETKEQKRNCAECQRDEEDGVNPPLPPWAEGLRRPCALRERCPDLQPGEWNSGTVITDDRSLLMLNALTDPACTFTLRLDGVDYTINLNQEDPNAASSATVNVEFAPGAEVELHVVSAPVPSVPPSSSAPFTSSPPGDDLEDDFDNDFDDSLPSFFNLTPFSEDDE